MGEELNEGVSVKKKKKNKERGSDKQQHNFTSNSWQNRFVVGFILPKGVKIFALKSLNGARTPDANIVNIKQQDVVIRVCKIRINHRHLW